jgi:hypothetical protein
MWKELNMCAVNNNTSDSAGKWLYLVISLWYGERWTAGCIYCKYSPKGDHVFDGYEVKKKVKSSLYRPGVAQRVPES